MATARSENTDEKREPISFPVRQALPTYGVQPIGSVRCGSYEKKMCSPVAFNASAMAENFA